MVDRLRCFYSDDKSAKVPAAFQVVRNKLMKTTNGQERVYNDEKAQGW